MPEFYKDLLGGFVMMFLIIWVPIYLIGTFVSLDPTWVLTDDNYDARGYRFGFVVIVVLSFFTGLGFASRDKDGE